MKRIDVTERFRSRHAQKRKVRVVFHWTASGSAAGTIDWLTQRADGFGSVGYNYIIEKNGDVYFLADPRDRWFHNTGRGTAYDSHTVSIAFVMRDGSEEMTEEQLHAAAQLMVGELDDWFDFATVTHHAAVNNNKQDFPEEIWIRLWNHIQRTFQGK